MSQLKTWELIGQQTTNEQLKVRLSNVGASSDLLTAVAEVSPVVLKPCKTRHRDIQKAKRQLPKDDIKFAQLVSDVEILEMVETEINNSTHESVLNMNDIEKSYVCFLEANRFTLPDYPRYKPYLKQLILDNIPDVHLPDLQTKQNQNKYFLQRPRKPC